jgi:hypothetical protein
MQVSIAIWRAGGTGLAHAVPREVVHRLARFLAQSAA